MRETRRAYRDAVAWVHSARPRRIERGRAAARAFGTALAGGVLVLGSLGLVAPTAFGPPTAGAATDRGLPSALLTLLVAGIALAALLRRRHLLWVAVRTREPFVRPLAEHPSFEGLVGALAACPGPLRARFALSWVWGPAALAGAGVVFALSAAYFVVEAVLAGGEVGLGQALLLVLNLALGLAAFAVAAARLSTWRVAASAHREATGAYR